jgi:hypothetical protein
MTVGHAEQFVQLEGAVIVFVPLGKEILEELRNESPFRVIDTTVGPMLKYDQYACSCPTVFLPVTHE